MSKIMIHTCLARLWYVEQYLIPSLLQQGIKDNDIKIYNDAEHNGNLMSTLLSFNELPQRGSTWHLQDDVIISSKFYEYIKYFDKRNKSGIVCGFCSKYDDAIKATGVQKVDNMWLSFPCIRIDNAYARGFIKWISENGANEKFKKLVGKNMYDDLLFKSYMIEKHKKDYVYNAAPNLVDNIDYLLGGSTLVKRKEKIKAIYFEDKELIKNLKQHIMA